MALDTDQLAARIAPLDELAPEDERPKPYDYQEDFWLARPYYSEDFAEEVLQRFGDHIEEWNQSPVGSVVWTAYRAYHNLGVGSDDPITQLVSAGENGELLAMAIPHYRSLVRHQIALFTKEPPAWDPAARTTDAQAARQVPMAANLLDFVSSTGTLNRRLAEQAETMMTAGAAFLITGWDANAGLDGRGWFTTAVLAPWEMAHERVRVYEDASWWIWRSFESRWDWVAHYAKDDPDKAEQIAKLDTRGESFAKMFLEYDGEELSRDGDRIAVLNVLARPTKACPEGRLAKVTTDNLVLFDGALPYGEEVPISRMCASEFLGTSIPYCDSWGVLAAAEAFNAVLSMIITRVDTAGVPNFHVPEGSELEYTDIAQGNGVWKLPPGGEKPGVVDLLSLPQELPALLQLLSQQMEQVVGINSVTRGQPAENVSSGSMAALLQSMALEFNSNLERAWIHNLEKVGTHHLRVFQRMADVEHAVSVMGADHRWTVQSFKGEDLAGISRVTVKTAGALSKTTAGRAEIADKLLERGAIGPQEYLRVIQTGQLEPLFHGPVGELTVIKARSERLLRGERTEAQVWDNHALCVREFRGLLNTEARDDPALKELINEQIMEHFQLWSQLSREAPDMLAAIGCPPLPQAQAIGQQAQALMQGPGMPGPVPPQAEGPRPQPQPETEEPSAKPGPAPAPKGAEPTGAPRMPKDPKPARNPINGEAVTG